MTDESIFAAALEKESAEEQIAFVAESSDDPDQRARVQSLLTAHAQAGAFLGRPAVESPTAYPPDYTRPYSTPAAEDPESLSFLAPSTRPDSLGRIGHYEVLEVLGRGGFGVVFRAFDDKLQRVVAVKVLAPTLSTTSPARKRFLREARSSAAVKHENVVVVHDVGEHPMPYMVMEFVPGETLQQRMNRTGPLDAVEALRIGRQLAEGLAAAHEKGLIHRDVKPSNILLEAGPAGRAKITDFGLARAADDASLTRSGTVAGTPMYMSPEQARGERVDARTDLFSLGSVLYTAVSGRPPFRAENTPAVLKRVADDTPRPIREIIPEVPEWFCRIVGKLHAKDTGERFQTARQVADLLADCEKQLAASKELTDYSRIPGGPPTPGRAWVWGWAIAGVLLALVLLNAAFVYWQEEWTGSRSMRYVGAIAVLVAVFGAGTANWSYRVARRGDRPRARRLQALAVAACVLMVGNFGVAWYKMSRVANHVRDLLRPDDGAGRNEGQQPEQPRKGVIVIVNRMPVQLFVKRTSPKPLVFYDGEENRSGAIISAPTGKYSIVAKESGRVILDESFELKEGEQREFDLSEADGFTQLFNGKDLTGWKTHKDQPGEWKVEEGEIVGSGTAVSHLFSEREYGDFHLRAQVKINSSGDSGVWFRTPFDLPKESKITGLRYPGGLEAQIYCKPGGDEDGKFTGSMGKEAAVRTALHPPNEWFDLEVIARGENVTTLVNGKKAAELRLTATDPRRGHIALQACGSNRATTVRFRKIEIQELPASPAAGVLRADPDAAEAVTVLIDATNSMSEHMPGTKRTRMDEAFTGMAELLKRVPAGTHLRVGTFAGAMQRDQSFGLSALLVAECRVDGSASQQMQVMKSLKQDVKLVNPSCSPIAGAIAHALDPVRGAEWWPKGFTGKRTLIVLTDGADTWEKFGTGYTDKKGNKVSPGDAVKEAIVDAVTGPAVAGVTVHLALFGMDVKDADEVKSQFEFLVKAAELQSHGRFWLVLKVKDGADFAARVSAVSRAAAPPKMAVAPFDKQAKAHQEEWATHLGLQGIDLADKKLNMEFRVIPPGEFQMGSADKQLKGEGEVAPLIQRGYDAETPQHKVRISRPFAIGKHEVTVGQFRKFVEAEKYTTTVEKDGGHGLVNGELVPGKQYSWKDVGYKQVDLAPVWNVSAADAEEFCKWLSRDTGQKFRLPTEAEWEWACRGGTADRTFFPEKTIHQYAWGPASKTDGTGFKKDEGAKKEGPQTVGQKLANPFGLHDTCGNVWEWCSDRYGENYYETFPANGTTDDPTGPAGPEGGKKNHRVQRGGSVFHLGTVYSNSTARPIAEHPGCGFRVVMELTPPGKPTGK